MDQHVCFWYQAPQDFPAFCGLEVERDGTLVAVDRKEHRTHARVQAHAIGAHEVALGRLDFYNVRAIVAEDLRRERPEHDRGEVEDAHPGERTAHGG